jgi:hypothetical protein
MAVDQGVVHAANVDLVPAEASLALRNDASPEAHLTLHSVVVKLNIMSRGMKSSVGT